MWAEGGQPLYVDDLVGEQEEGKFCDPTYIYHNNASNVHAYIWGPTYEIIVFFDGETRLVDTIRASQGYLGSLSGTVSVDGTETTVVIQPRDRVRIGDRELDVYTSQANQAEHRNAWFNLVNVNTIYRMVRQNFFDENSLSEDFDCVAQNRCALLYTADDKEESEKQETVLWILDSGIQLHFTPEGHIDLIFIMPVRTAPFEVTGEIDFGPTGAVSPRYRSSSLATCEVNLSGMTWREFREACIDSDRTMSRVSFNVFSQRDAVSVEFEGIDVEFQRRTSIDGVFADGEAPADDDVLMGINFTALLSAPVAQCVPLLLGERYRELLTERISKAVWVPVTGSVDDPDDPDGPEMLHPLLAYDIVVPDSLETTPQGIGPLLFQREEDEELKESWIPSVISEVHSIYENLTEQERDRVDPNILNPVFLIEPFVQTVLEAFSLGMINEDDTSVITFRTTDDLRWCIGYASFYSEGVPYRIIVQYSLDFGYISAVMVNQGSSELDELYFDLNRQLRTTYDYYPDNPYYDLTFTIPQAAENPYRLGGDAIQVTGVDLAMGTVDVTLTSNAPPKRAWLSSLIPMSSTKRTTTSLLSSK